MSSPPARTKESLTENSNRAQQCGATAVKAQSAGVGTEQGGALSAVSNTNDSPATTTGEVHDRHPPPALAIHDPPPVGEDSRKQISKEKKVLSEIIEVDNGQGARTKESLTEKSNRAQQCGATAVKVQSAGVGTEQGRTLSAVSNTKDSPLTTTGEVHDKHPPPALAIHDPPPVGEDSRRQISKGKNVLSEIIEVDDGQLERTKESLTENRNRAQQSGATAVKAQSAGVGTEQGGALSAVSNTNDSPATTTGEVHDRHPPPALAIHDPSPVGEDSRKQISKEKKVLSEIIEVDDGQGARTKESLTEKSNRAQQCGATAVKVQSAGVGAEQGRTLSAVSNTKDSPLTTTGEVHDRHPPPALAIHDPPPVGEDSRRQISKGKNVLSEIIELDDGQLERTKESLTENRNRAQQSGATAVKAQSAGAGTEQGGALSAVSNIMASRDWPREDPPIGPCCMILGRRGSQNQNRASQDGATAVGTRLAQAGTEPGGALSAGVQVQQAGAGNSGTEPGRATLAGAQNNHHVQFEMQIVLLSTLHVAVHYGLGLPSVPSIFYPSPSSFAPSPAHHSIFSFDDYGLQDYFNSLCNYLTFLALLTTVMVAIVLFCSCRRRHPHYCATVERNMSRALRASYLMTGSSALIRAFILYANLIFIIYGLVTVVVLVVYIVYLYLLRAF